MLLAPHTDPRTMVYRDRDSPYLSDSDASPSLSTVRLRLVLPGTTTIHRLLTLVIDVYARDECKYSICPAMDFIRGLVDRADPYMQK